MCVQGIGQIVSDIEKLSSNGLVFFIFSWIDWKAILSPGFSWAKDFNLSSRSVGLQNNRKKLDTSINVAA
jgi:hypothetical protein